MARYPLLKAEEEIELARCVTFLIAAEEKQQQLELELGRQPQKGRISSSLRVRERTATGQSALWRSGGKTHHDSF